MGEPEKPTATVESANVVPLTPPIVASLRHRVRGLATSFRVACEAEIAKFPEVPEAPESDDPVQRIRASLSNLERIWGAKQEAHERLWKRYGSDFLRLRGDLAAFGLRDADLSRGIELFAIVGAIGFDPNDILEGLRRIDGFLKH